MKPRTTKEHEIVKTSFDVGLDDGSSGRYRRHSFEQWMHRSEYNRGYQVGMRRRSGSKWTTRKYNRVKRWICKPMFVRAVKDSLLARIMAPSRLLQTCVVESKCLSLLDIQDV